MAVELELQNTIDSKLLPKVEELLVWVSATLKAVDSQLETPELTIRVVSSAESQQLNDEYRQKNYPTNVLSFPFEAPEMIPADELDDYLGDLVICEQVLLDEAKAQGKSYHSHFAHLVIHGVLHLMGFDHVEEQQAEQMESMEIAILNKLGFANPYQPE